MKLIADRLACRRGGRLLFEDLSFSLEPGRALIVTGRNGAGKSSLIAILSGSLEAQAGTIRLDDGEANTPSDNTTSDLEPASLMHMVGHRDALKPALSAAENLAFAAALLGGGGLAPPEALARLGLSHIGDLPVGYLSAGQRRRVALARLLVARRPLWLLDEPTASLDVASSERLAGLMRDHLAEGGMIVAATHLALGLEDAQELRIGP